MKSKIKEINKAIKKETKELAKIFVSNEDKLTIKLSTNEIIDSLMTDSNKKPLPLFKHEFKVALTETREYSLKTDKEVEVILDKKCKKIYIDAFKTAWNKYFAVRLLQKKSEIKQIKKKNVFSLLMGLIALVIVVAFSVSWALVGDGKAFEIATIVIDTVFNIIAWVFIWEFIYDVSYTLKDTRIELLTIYSMYKAKIQTK